MGGGRHDLGPSFARHWLWGLIRRIKVLNIYIYREGQTDSTPVDKYLFTWTTKDVFDVTQNFNYRAPL